MNYPGLEGKKYRFLVTGGAGFIGSNLAFALLGLGQSVTVLDNYSTGLRDNIEDIKSFVRNEENISSDDFRMVEGDICDRGDCAEAAKDSDFVLHNAALGSVPRSVEDPVTTTDVNVTGTVNMLKAAFDAGVKRFVYASSSSVYGDSEALPKVEGAEGSPLSPYAVSKLVDEIYASNFERVYGMETVGLRYFNIFGPRQDPVSPYAAVIPIFVTHLMAGTQATINGDGLTSRDFTYVDNAVQANILAALSGPEASGRAYNIACGGSVTLNDLYAKLATLLGAEDVKPVYGPERPGDVRASHADITQAKTMLGYDPTIGFEKGLETSIDWYRENLSCKEQAEGPEHE